MRTKMYKLPNGKTVVFDYDENGVGKVTVEAMDSIMGMIGAEPTGPTVKPLKRLDIAAHFIQQNIEKADCGLFFRELSKRDIRTTLYKDGDFEIRICYGWRYFEVLGLTKKEKRALKKYYEDLTELF